MTTTNSEQNQIFKRAEKFIKNQNRLDYWQNCQSHRNIVPKVSFNTVISTEDRDFYADLDD
jgi:hypothetical protein